MSQEITFFGHFCLGLRLDEHFLLVDPFFEGNPAASVDPYGFEKVDYILVTHGHGDHVGDTMGLAKHYGATVVSNFEIINWLQARGVEKAHAQHIGGSHRHAFGDLKLTIAHHGSSMPDGSYGGQPAGLLIRSLSGKRIYISGDTGLFYDMKLIGEESLDLAVLPIGDNFTMGPDDAFRALKLLQPKRAIPVHYDTWSLIGADAAAWARRVREELGIEVDVLKPGEKILL
ncbi:MAG: metal-dependent hydrolase [Myxococcota bacterium]|jgi:L-ascorbate metabolism protein UlaG (beta-lactamase superfamily)|nr:metal-dependent hydrolase [Myxococcota bacterium]